jgi:fimbrial chaperone protein
VAPVLVDVTAPGSASTVTLRNEGATPINAQIRVFRWSLIDGQEKLEPTEDVVASPPSVTLAPNGQYIARIVRVSKQPVAGEESYRLLVDQLPDLSQRKSGAVNLLMRYSIPVFFGAPTKKNPTVAWSLAVKGDKVTLTAHNSGDRRLRISALALHDAKGKSVSFGSGLAGYALGQSTKSWTLPARGFANSGSATISGQSDGGPIQATATIASR